MAEVSGLGIKIHGIDFLDLWLRVERLVGGDNHCHLAKFRGLVYGGEYSAVIGLQKSVA
jgi:hypothetical protein